MYFQVVEVISKGFCNTNFVSGSTTEQRILNTYFHLCGGSYKEVEIAMPCI